MIRRVFTFSVILTASFLIVTSTPAGSWVQTLLPERRDAVTFTEPTAARGAGLSADELNNIDIYKKARLATVNITSTVYRRGWFEIYPSSDQGSGFLIDSDGHVLTNSHVLQGRGQIQVTLENQEIYDAEILVRDRKNDLALIKIKPKTKLPYLILGDSDHVQVGQKVLAIGNPFGLDGTLTTGIISSVSRSIRDEKGVEMEGMIQTDAAINPGNSGGPLLDSHGNVIGINTAIYGAAGSIGIGFAMPVSRAKRLVEDYRAGKKFGRAYLGVTAVFVAGDLAEALELPRGGGLLVQQVFRGSPGATAGMRPPNRIVIVGNIELGVGGDLILAIDGKPADRNDALARALSAKRPGDKMELTVYRGARVVQVPITLSEDPYDVE